MSLSEVKSNSIPAQTVIFHKITARMATLNEDVNDYPCQLEKDLKEQGIQPEGPIIFIYHGLASDMTQPFTLQMAIPVAENIEYSGSFQKSCLPKVDVLEATYEGTMTAIGPKGWEPLMGSLLKSGVNPKGDCREVYLRWEGIDSESNLVILQQEV